MLFSCDIHGTTVSYGVGLFANISKAVVSPGKSLKTSSVCLLLRLCADFYVQPSSLDAPCCHLGLGILHFTVTRFSDTAGLQPPWMGAEMH